MDQYCVALLLIVFFIIYMDNKNNMEGFTLDSVSAPVGDNAPLQEGGNLKELPKHLDATDGLAAAVCHHFQKNSSTSTKSYTGWKSFITDNPKKVK